jgi:hypothetical protein
MNLNSKVELLIRNLFAIYFKMEDGNAVIKFSNFHCAWVSNGNV